jgi:hypothetical protein
MTNHFFAAHAWPNGVDRCRHDRGCGGSVVSKVRAADETKGTTVVGYHRFDAMRCLNLQGYQNEQHQAESGDHRGWSRDPHMPVLATCPASEA